LDWLFTLAIGLHVTALAVSFIVAFGQESVGWWLFRAGSAMPLIVLSGALVAQSLKRAERGY